ncbi:hypothetical protein HYY71_05745 [Candidatus Woesearchaeota archaeon]|nr:hypothetical protein [Candidatus Woesearchaeota archaeon]
MERKSYLFILIILVLLGTIAIILTTKTTIPTNQYRNYVISGKITSAEKITGKMPDFVHVYYPFYNLDFLCRSSRIELTKISWINEHTGEYEILLNVPVGLHQVILTTDCTTCDYINLSLKDIPTSVDLKWGDRKCPSNFKISDNKLGIVKDTRTFLNKRETNLVNKPYTSTEKFDIGQDIERSRQSISQSEDSSDANESLLHAYYAQWFSWRVLFRIELYDLKYCLNKINILLEKYNDSCFIPDYSSHDKYRSANSTYHSTNNRYFDYFPYEKKEPEKMIAEILSMRSLVEWLSDANNNCENSESVMKNTFEFQEPYCKARKFKIQINYIIWAIVFIYLGLLIEKFIRWKK